MGKQINYWMDYDNFLMVAQKAVDLGCKIIKEDLKLGRVIESGDISIITHYGKSNHTEYYFHLPEAGAIEIRSVDSKECLDYGYTATGNSIIEAGYSLIVNEPTGVAGTRWKREIRRARIYCITGYYDENEDYISRPDCLTKVYNSLVRYIKKIAPYTEFVDMLVSMRDENYGENFEYRHKEYITKSCLDLVKNEGYRLC
ncbi:hypothetical protein [Clostridium sp. AN503]|uniref:hypothetical protein n=1 Tax=Clostridium sp. AN503 TaxID=3160598 RepID=UPI00345B186C